MYCVIDAAKFVKNYTINSCKCESSEKIVFFSEKLVKLCCLSVELFEI